jgi:uncharacterized protein
MNNLNYINMNNAILDSREIKKIVHASVAGMTEAEVSLDLGLTKTTVKIFDESAIFPDEQTIGMKILKKAGEDETTCFLVQDSELLKLFFYSEETEKTYKLRATGSWPALEISGILMHRVKGLNPREDAEAKIKAIGRITGRVLDTCMGLGYTTILAAQYADSVYTFEKDKNVLELAQYNPYSQELFSDKKITTHKEDISEAIKGMKDASIDVIIHDPPTISIAGELYSDEFYSQLLRVLKSGGKLLHYTGEPGSKKRGVNLPASVAKRLNKAGFKEAEIVGIGLILAKK